VAIALSGTPVLSNSGSTTAASMTATLASTTIGALNVIAVSANTTGTGVDPAQSMPAGWTAVPSATSGKTGTPYHRLSLFYRFYQAGDTNPTVSIAALGNIECACVAYSGVDSTTPFVTGEVLAQPQGASSTSWSTGSITMAAARWVISVFANRTSGTWSGLTDTQRLTGIVASSANIAYEDTNGTVAAGTVTARTATFSAATSVGNTVIVALNPASGGATLTANPADAVGVTDAATLAAELVSGDAVGLADGAAVSLTSAGSASPADLLGVTDAVQVVQSRFVTSADSLGITDVVSLQTPIVQQLLSGSIQYAAHRNGTYATYGEETLEGYQAAAAQYSKAILEISVWDTSDGVYVCSHDSTTGRVFSGTNRTINSTTWATFSPNGASTVGRPTTLVGGNPMRRIEEILDALPGRFFIVENKHGTNQAGLAALLDAHAPGHWMFKGPYNDTANAVIAAGHGAPMWLYFYPSQLSSMATTYAAVSGAGVPIVFGLGDYSTAPVPVQSDASTFWSSLPAGVMAWAHILGTTTQKATADSQATTAGATFNGYMVSAYPTLAPTDANSLADPVGITDVAATASAAQKAPADPVGLSDTATTAAGYTVNAADSLGLADSASTSAAYAPQAVDPINATDAVVTGSGAVKGITDPVGVTDGFTSASDAARITSDPVSLVDSVQAAVGYTAAAADVEGLADAAVASVDAPRAAADSAGIVDSAAGILDAVRASADPLGLSDAAQAAAGYAAASSDLVGIGDSSTSSVDYRPAAADQGGLTDAVTIAYSYSQTSADAVGMTDSISVVLVSAGSASITDPISGTDSASTAVVYVQQPTDSAGLTDSVTVQITSTLLAADLVGLSDAVLTGADRLVSAVDSLGLSDSAQATVAPASGDRDLTITVTTGTDRGAVATAGPRWSTSTGTDRWTVTTAPTG